MAVAEEELRLPLDRSGFLRRECPRCHRQFKLRWSEREGRGVLRSLGLVVLHQNVEEVAPGALLDCPYCAYRAGEGEWWTEEQRIFLSKRASTLDEEIRFEQLRHVERTLAQNPYPTFLPVAPAPFRVAIRAEPDDMRRVPLVCCGEEVKVRESWLLAIRCPFCGIEHDPGPTR